MSPITSLYQQRLDQLSAFENKSTTTKKTLELLDALERVPVFNGSLNPNESEIQTECFKKFRAFGEKQIKLLELSTKNLSGHEPTHYTQVTLRVIALCYRIEFYQKKALSQRDQDDFISQAALWKSNKELYHSDKEKALTAGDKKRLSDLCLYPEIVKLVLKDKNYKEKCLTWLIRDCNPVKEFVEYPATCQRLKETYLSNRVGRFAGKMLSIEEESDSNNSQVTKKVITLLFETPDGDKRISVLDEEQKVTLVGGKQGRSLKIKEIFDFFQKKPGPPSDLEVLNGRICNWHSFEMGRYNPDLNSYDCKIDFKSENWWEDLPVFEEIEATEVKRRYGKEPKGNALVAVVAKRKVADTDIEDRHMYFEIAMPSKDDKYRILPFGNFPIEYPETTLEKLTFLGKTVESRCIMPDLNTFVSGRQAGIWAMDWDETTTLIFLKKLGETIQTGLEGNLPFQFVNGNCSTAVQELINHATGNSNDNFTQTKPGESYPSNSFMNGLFALIRMIPSFLSEWFTYFILWMVDGGKKMVTRAGKVIEKSVLHSCINKNGKIDIKISTPNLFFKQLEYGTKEGPISGGFQLWVRSD